MISQLQHRHGMVWQWTAAHLMVARKLGRREELEREINPYRPQSKELPPTRPLLPSATGL